MKVRYKPVLGIPGDFSIGTAAMKKVGNSNEKTALMVGTLMEILHENNILSSRQVVNILGLNFEEVPDGEA